MKSTILELRNVSLKYKNDLILNNINFSIEEGEFITILGPSGCGKTSLLRIIAGFENNFDGDIFFYNENLKKIEVYNREINTVFQNYSLFQHLNVYDNISFGLKIKKFSKEEIKKKVTSILNLLNLVGKEKKNINQLSGGQQQRVSIARALVNEPKILLLDEPFSAIDSKLRKQLQIELKKIQKKIKTTFIFVTHDQEEALTLSDRLIILKNGQIQQIGDPLDIYNEPINKWIASFIGKSNIFEGYFIKDNEILLNEKKFFVIDKNWNNKKTKVDILIRPEDIKIVEKNKGFFNGKIISIFFRGVHWEIIVKLFNNQKWIINITKEYFLNQEIGIKWDKEDIHPMWKQEKYEFNK